MLTFFVACVPPKTNHQRKRIVRVGKFARLADAPELNAAKATLDALLLPHQPAAPIPGPVRLAVGFVFPWRTSEPKKRRALGRVPHTARPDASNLVKTLEDRLVALRFLDDDGQVATLVACKWWGDTPGIEVSISTITSY